MRALLDTLRGLRPPPAEPPLRDLSPFEQRMAILRAKWDRRRPMVAEEREPAVIYTPLSAMAWLSKTERELGRPVTTAEILQRRAAIKHPTSNACRALSSVLKRAGAISTKQKGQTHLRWSAA